MMQSQVAIWVELGRRMAGVADALDRDDASLLKTVAAHGLYQAALEAGSHTPWFTRTSVTKALHALAHMLRPDAVEKWFTTYFDTATPSATLTGSLPSRHTGKQHEGTEKTWPVTTHNLQPATILVIMAGNIPLVGFHDMLCVLASGHHLLAKLSSQDKKLPIAMGELIGEIEPAFAGRIEFVEGPARDFDAVIATGSNNSSRYFDYYFGKHPHIIRRNRTSLAVLSGNESREELTALGEDVFTYFGLGCRNVSMLWIPEKFDLDTLTHAWTGYDGLRMHNKYMNNYDYQKAIMLVNKLPFTDTGFCLLREDHQLHSPVAVVHFQRYTDINEVQAFWRAHNDELQCIVAGKEVSESLTGERLNEPVVAKAKAAMDAPSWVSVAAGSLLAFGTGQSPELWDYADGVDTMRFLTRPLHSFC